MPIPSFDDLEDEGFSFSEAAEELARRIDQAPAEERIAHHMDSVRYWDSMVREAEFLFERQAAQVRGTPNCYAFVIDFNDERESSLALFAQYRAWHIEKIEAAKKEIRAIGD